MKIQIASFSSSGGAGNVARNLISGFSEIGIDAEFFSSIDSNLRREPLALPKVTAAAALDNFFLKAPNWKSLISVTRDKVELPFPLADETDVLMLRWGNGMLNQNLIAELGNRTLVMGLDDMNTFTGGCHYAGSCEGFHNTCVSCPCVKAPFRKMVQKNLERKRRLLGQVKNLTVVATTPWMQDQFSKSSFSEFAQPKVVKQPLDPRFFSLPSSTQSDSAERKKLRVLIMAANLDDPIKGVLELWPHLEGLVESGMISLTLIGEHSSKMKTTMRGAGFTGRLNVERIIGHLDSSDILIIPSLEENAGTVVAEAASRGVPTIARRIGGLVDEIGDNEKGWFFEENQEVPSLLLSLSLEEIKNMGKRARKSSMEYTPAGVAEKYVQILSSSQ